MPDLLDRLKTALADRYTIEDELGAGGMATVYLAHDRKHDRKVAVKVLRPELAAVIGGERFLVEIKTTANLQHPHILPLFDSGEADGFLYYVMPFIDGESLREKLNKETQLGIDEAVGIAKDVADALDYAHRHEVIHRDIKPENILLQDGRPVVADFGIALAVSAAAGGRMTETGLSLGTPHYMSPEQATAEKDLTNRSDIYSLGCVLYETLTGDPPHTGASAQAVIIRILTEEPRSISDARRSVPPNVASAVTKALEKLPADRFESAAAFRDALGESGFTHARATAALTTAAPSPDSRARSSLGRILPWGVAALMAVLWAVSVFRPAPEVLLPTTRTRLTGRDMVVLPSGASGWRLAISPDGSWIVVGDRDEGGVFKLYARRSDALEFRELPGTEGATNPVFSPDGEWVAFTSGGSIKKVSLLGGPAFPVAEGDNPHWGVDATIVFTTSGNLYRVSASGGEPTLILAGDSTVVPYRPHLLPDGEAVVFSTNPNLDPVSARIMLLELSNGEVKPLVSSGNAPRYVPTGHILFGHGEQSLFAVSFDLASHEVTGDPVPVIPEVTVYNGGATQFAVSETGTAVYNAAAAVGGGGGSRRLVLVNMDGTRTPLPQELGSYWSPRFSPEGRRIAYQRDLEIWIYDLTTGTNQQLTFTGLNVYPWWSGDGRHVYFNSRRNQTFDWDGFRKAADGSGEAEQLFRREGVQFVRLGFANDSSILVLDVTDERGEDLLLMRPDADSVIFTPYLRADWDEEDPALSPDGRWLAYVSDATGEEEVYVRAFPVPSGQWKVSQEGGNQPVWDPDGRTIYYHDGTGLVAASVSIEGVFAPGPSTQLFAAGDARLARDRSRSFDIHPDGSHFVMVGAAEGEDDQGAPGDLTLDNVVVVTNWFAELRERMGKTRN